MDSLTLYERPILAAESQLVDDGSGTAQIWKFSQSNITEVPINNHGNFYSGHCYLVLYSYDKPSLNYIIYYWLVCIFELTKFFLIKYFFKGSGSTRAGDCIDY